MATIESSYELNKGDEKLAELIASNIRNLLASGLHVSVTIEATGEDASQEGWSPTQFQQLVKLFVDANKGNDGKVAFRERVEAETEISTRTFGRWEAGQNDGRLGSQAKRFLRFILGVQGVFSVTEDMRTIATSLSS